MRANAPESAGEIEWRQKRKEQVVSARHRRRLKESRCSADRQIQPSSSMSPMNTASVTGRTKRLSARPFVEQGCRIIRIDLLPDVNGLKCNDSSDDV